MDQWLLILDVADIPNIWIVKSDCPLWSTTFWFRHHKYELFKVWLDKEKNNSIPVIKQIFARGSEPISGNSSERSVDGRKHLMVRFLKNLPMMVVN